MDNKRRSALENWKTISEFINKNEPVCRRQYNYKNQTRNFQDQKIASINVLFIFFLSLIRLL